MKGNKVYTEIASRLIAIENCVTSGNTEWETKHADAIEEICKDYMPHGSGFDSGVKFSFEKSTPARLVFIAPFHHMDENGYYCGWVDYTVIVKPSLAFGYTLRITGRDYNGFKEYAYDVFNECLTSEIK